jgi:hypothetical protein
MLPSEQDIQALCPSLGLSLDAIDLQFLWLVPVVNLMWVDDRCQPEEVKVLLHYADRYVQSVAREVPGVTRERIRAFLKPLLDPAIGRDPAKRAELARLSAFIVKERAVQGSLNGRSLLLDICVQVARVAGTEDAEPGGRKISIHEEKLLADLLRALRLDR